MIIQCISERKTHRDTSFNTGDWLQHQFKDVPDDVGRRMLWHTDVYALAKKPPKGRVEKVVIDTSEEDHLQDMHSKISLMTKEQARNFIERNYGRKIDLRHFKTDDSIRAEALMLFNQFGGD